MMINIIVLVIGPNGEVSISLIPEPESIWDSVWLGIGVALTAIALVTIAITVPGAGCIMASIALGAAKGALVGAASGFAMGFITGGASNLINCAVTGEAVDWSGVLKDSLNAGIKGAVDGAITGAIMGGIGGALKPKFCFPAGTLVAAAGGKVAIENVRVGDSVLARDDRTGKVERKEVTQTFTNQTRELTKVKAGEEVITSTPSHPYYVEGRGYIEAKYLRAGDKLLSVNGQKVVVEWVQHELLESPITVYNFEVQEHHNYFVGDSTGVLVHNACGPKTKFTNAELKSNGFNVQEGNVSVYISRDAKGKINYAGITNNMQRRTWQHKAAGKGIVPEEVVSGISRNDAKGIEQALIDKLGGCKRLHENTPLLNIINSVAESNKEMELFVKEGTNIFEKLLKGILF